jgi:hypothetical protein
MALPIEIPETVTDEDAFRRYLSVRRGAYVDARAAFNYEDGNNSIPVRLSEPAVSPTTL